MTDEEYASGLQWTPEQIAGFKNAISAPYPSKPRPFFPRVSRMDYGTLWVIDGRRSERYTRKRWRMCVHWMLALVFG